jgi:hypothetical protein
VQPRDVRSRFDPPDIREFYRLGRSPGWNEQAHVDDREGQHTKSLIYTSAATLVLTAGTPFWPTLGGRIVGWRAGVAGAPSTGTFQADVLLDAVSVLDGGYVEIASGSSYGYRRAPSDKLYIYPDSKWQVQVVAIQGATGPLTLEFVYLPG